MRSLWEMVKGWWDRNFTLKGFLGLAMLLYSAIPDWIARNDFWRDKVHALGAFLLTPIGRLALVVSGIAIIWLDHRSASKKHSVRQLGKSFLPLGIKSARFGVDDNRYKDVTTQVRANIKNNRVNMLVSTNTLMGGADPFYGEVKHLIVEYFFGDGPIVHIVRREQDQLEIPERPMTSNLMRLMKVKGGSYITGNRSLKMSVQEIGSANGVRARNNLGNGNNQACLQNAMMRNGKYAVVIIRPQQRRRSKLLAN
jgi:hypothetical protein